MGLGRPWLGHRTFVRVVARGHGQPSSFQRRLPPMSLLISPRHHHRFRTVLEDSFRLRREVFVDGLGWSLPHADRTAQTGLEYDDFDGDAASYLVNLNSAGRVMAAVRITPSTEPNVSCDSLAK